MTTSPLVATPAPWKVEEIARGASGLMWMRVKRADGYTLATVEGEPDAHLMAASPRLLAALEALISVGDGIGSTLDGGGLWCSRCGPEGRYSDSVDAIVHEDGCSIAEAIAAVKEAKGIA